MGSSLSAESLPRERATLPNGKPPPPCVECGFEHALCKCAGANNRPAANAAKTPAKSAPQLAAARSKLSFLDKDKATQGRMQTIADKLEFVKSLHLVVKNDTYDDDLKRMEHIGNRLTDVQLVFAEYGVKDKIVVEQQKKALEQAYDEWIKDIDQLAEDICTSLIDVPHTVDPNTSDGNKSSENV